MCQWIQDTEKGVLLRVHITPNSAKNHTAGFYGGSLNIKIKAPAVDGKANKALISFLADLISVKKSQIKIVSGEKSRNKTLLLTNISKELVHRIFSSPC